MAIDVICISGISWRHKVVSLTPYHSTIQETIETVEPLLCTHGYLELYFSRSIIFCYSTVYMYLCYL